MQCYVQYTINKISEEFKPCLFSKLELRMFPELQIVLYC